MEGRLVLSELLERWPDYRVAGDVTRASSTLLRQIADLPVLFQP